MKFAYADPPYLGCCGRYGHRHEAPYGCWNDVQTHRLLIDNLCAKYPDGWALSLNEPSLRVILPMCPEDTRSGPWIKPFAVFRQGVNPAFAWEPVIWRGGRPFSRHQETVRDWWAGNITMKTGTIGAKPPGFGMWIASLLNVEFAAGDTIDDLFPGSHGMTLEWESRSKQPQQIELQERPAPEHNVPV